jgi:hypothetical protein
MSPAPKEHSGLGFAGFTGHARPQVILAAFGKHPGWSDFMDDIGMETEALIAAKRTLYVRGIASQIETGAWNKLEPDKRLGDFNHVFLWRRPEQFLIGRIWSSVDAKGRREYPMVICADCLGLPVVWALQELLPKLEEVRAACQSARSSAEVSSALNAAQSSVRSRIAALPKTALGGPDSSAAHSRFLGRREWGSGQEGLYRILHQMQGQLSAYGVGKAASLSDTIFLRKSAHGEPSPLSQQIRVPQAADTPVEALWQWNDFFQHQLDRATPVLFVLYLDQKWVDITIGEPTNREFFSLKASVGALPLANDVPYELDEESRAFARNFIASYGAQSPASGANSSALTRAMLSLVLLLILALAFAGFLRFAPERSVPDFLRGLARSVGNPGLAPSAKP